MTVRARAWTGLAIPPLSWFLFQQGLSALLHADCHRSWTGVVWGLVSVFACGAALRLAWPLRRGGDEQGDFWLVRLVPLVAGFFALAILFQTLAVAMVPSCVR